MEESPKHFSSVSNDNFVVYSQFSSECGYSSVGSYYELDDVLICIQPIENYRKDNVIVLTISDAVNFFISEKGSLSIGKIVDSNHLGSCDVCMNNIEFSHEKVIQLGFNKVSPTIVHPTCFENQSALIKEFLQENRVDLIAHAVS